MTNKADLHWIALEVRDDNRNIIERMSWDNLRRDQTKRWGWYFRLRGAMLQVKYPRHRIEHVHGFVNPELNELQRIRNKIIARKRKITEMKNKMKAIENTWNELFPIEEHPIYKKIQEKFSRLNRELDELHSEMKSKQKADGIIV